MDCTGESRSENQKSGLSLDMPETNGVQLKVCHLKAMLKLEHLLMRNGTQAIQTGVLSCIKRDFKR